MFLIKSGEKAHLLELQKKGKIHIGTLTYYSNIEDEKRRDNLENIYFRLTKPHRLSVKEGNSYTTIATITNGEANYTGYIFCMHDISLWNTEFEKKLRVDTKGNHILIINKDKFLDKIEKKLKQQRIEYKPGNVTYKDFSNFSGIKTPFEKPLKFANEREFRLYFSIEETKPFLDLYIGSIEEFSILQKFSEHDTFRIIESDDSEGLAPI